MHTAQKVFRASLGVDRDWRAATDQVVEALGDCADDTVGFVYVTDLFAAKLPQIVDRLIEQTAITDWVGTIGFGVMANGSVAYNQPAVTAMAARFPRDAMALFDCVPPEAWRGQGDGLATAIVHADPRNTQLPVLLGEIGNEISAFLIGGVTACRNAQFSQIAGMITDSGVSGLLLGAQVPVSIGVTQGCRPIGPARTITAARDGVVLEIDGASPLEVLLGDLTSVGVSDLRGISQSLHAGVMVPNSDTGDYLVRNVTGVDTDRGWIAIGEVVEIGQRLLFCQRDRHAAEADLVAMATRLKARAGGSIRGALYISCIARGPHLFGQGDDELTLLQNVLGSVPLVGFYANGEIAGDRIYGYTGVLALF